MTAAEWAKVKEWFGEAIDADPGDLQKILDQAEQASPELAAELRSLLREHESHALRTAAVLAEPAVRQEAALPAEQVGPYRILSELGRGGAGVVFLAERSDDEFHRRVALKLLRYVAYDQRSEEMLTLERRALSQLQHPNIAALVDWGTTADDIPWLAVEYVEGQPIDEYGRFHDLSVAAILDLFDQVCQAVQYAHRHLIVHRDLKPGNILVSETGIVKLLDFGISKLLNQDSAFTMDRRFTPAYASPEQIQGGEITAATDVYALGLLLYELLAGSLPHAGGTLEDMVQRITEDAPPAPSHAANVSAERRRAIGGDLDRIILHALAKDPEQRYPSVEQFLADIERYRAGYPISIRRPNAAYLAAKFVRRNLLSVAAFTLAVVALLAGAGVAVWNAREARREQQAAEHRFKELQSLAHSVIFDLHDSIRRIPGSVEARRMLVSTALKYLDGLQAENIKDDSLQMELANGYYRMAYVQGGTMGENLGDAAGGRRSYQKALAILDQLSRRHPDDSKIAVLRYAVAYNSALSNNNPVEGLDLARRYSVDADAWEAKGTSLAAFQSAGLLHQAIGRTLRSSGDLDGALREYSRAEGIFKKEIEAATTNALQPMVNDVVSRPQAYHDLSLTLASESGTLLDMERLAEAVAAHNEFLRNERYVLELDSGDSSARGMLASDHGWLSMAALQGGRPAEALAEARAEMENVRAISAKDRANMSALRDLSQAQRHFGNALCATRDVHGCIANLHEAADSITAIAEKDPAYLMNRFMQSGTLNDYGNALLHAGPAQAETAERVFRSAAEIADASVAQAPTRVELLRERARGYGGAGRAELLRGQPDVAQELLRRSAADWVEFHRRSPAAARFLDEQRAVERLTASR